MTIPLAFSWLWFIVVMVIFVEAWLKRSLLALWVGAFFGCVAWFTSPYSEESHYLVGAIAIALLGVITSWWNRSQPVRATACVIAAMLTMCSVFVTSDRANHLYFEQFVGKIISFAVVCGFAGICLLYVIPRLDQKRQAPVALLLSCVSAVGMFVTAFSWWMTAVMMNVYPNNPVVRSRAELLSEYEKKAQTLDDRGLFLVGKISESGSVAPGDYVAYYSLEDEAGKFPLTFQVRLISGDDVEVRGVSRSNQTFNWDSGGPRLWTRCLRAGDPVVVWGQPAKASSMTDGKESYGIGSTYLVARGELEDFQQNFLLPGRQTAKLFGWIGFACMIASLLVFIPGIANFMTLRRYGHEERSEAISS